MRQNYPPPEVKQSNNLDLTSIQEPDWSFLIPDRLAFAHGDMPGAVQARPKLNYTARRYAKEQWETIIESLRENGTLTLDTLDLAKNLVLVRVRIAMASNVLFSQGLEYYDIDLNRMRASCGAAEMDSAIRISVLLMESLGMTPKSRDKVSKVERKEQPKRASGVYLKSVS